MFSEEEKLEKQKKLAKDYEEFLMVYEEAKSRGAAIGTFIAWQHVNNPTGPESRLTIHDVGSLLKHRIARNNAAAPLLY